VGVKSSKVVFLVLRWLARELRPTSAAELSKALSLPMTTTVRALSTLEAAGYAERFQTSNRYVLGKAARTLAFGFLAQFPIRNLAMPYLQRLTLETGFTSALFVRLGWYAVRVAAVLGQTMIVHRTPIGEARDLVTGVPSKAMLAFLNGDEIASAIARAEMDPPRDEALRAELAERRKVGFVLGASLSDAAALDFAVPLFDNKGRVIGAIAIEEASGSSETTLVKAGGPARQIIDELSARIRDESTVAMSHYDHVDPDVIEL
jgi:DNA-binding IclR family transcriptional regulator